MELCRVAARCAHSVLTARACKDAAELLMEVARALGGADTIEIIEEGD